MQARGGERMVRKSTVTVDRGALEQLCKLYEGIRHADQHFPQCMNTGFRNQIKSLYQAQNAQTGFKAVKKTLSSERQQAE